jgi:hypothetical protein
LVQADSADEQNFEVFVQNGSLVFCEVLRSRKWSRALFIALLNKPITCYAQRCAYQKGPETVSYKGVCGYMHVIHNKRDCLRNLSTTLITATVCVAISSLSVPQVIRIPSRAVSHRRGARPRGSAHAGRSARSRSGLVHGEPCIQGTRRWRGRPL